MKPYSFGWKPTQEALRWLEQDRICTREKLLQCIRDRREKAQQASRTDRTHSAGYFSVLDDLFAKLYAKTEKLILFERLEPCWVYEFTVSSAGALVLLRHVSYITRDETGLYHAVFYNANYTLLSIPCRMVSVDEFSLMNGVEHGTVLQWIRRGKIRSVSRIGREWRISELTELPGRKYDPGIFTWTLELADLPAEYDFLREPATVYITQDQSDSQKFILSLYREDEEPQLQYQQELTGKQREKLELMLLSHPLVHSGSMDKTKW